MKEAAKEGGLLSSHDSVAGTEQGKHGQWPQYDLKPMQGPIAGILAHRATFQQIRTTARLN